jgi:predicted NAD/FAD-binding protein
VKIAVIGTGISGLTAAYLLHPGHDLTLFEAGDHVGGHTDTHDVEQEGKRYAVDTGFIVFNALNYPNFTRLLERLGVASSPSSMSFSVRCERTGLEYNGTSVDTLFAQRRNLLRPGHYRMIREIFRFNREAPELLGGNDSLTVGDYLSEKRYSREFIDHYLVPMGAAIWSTEPEGLLARFPARYFVEFLSNHRMMQVEDRPLWRTIRGGSARYVEALTAAFRDRIRLRTPVLRVTRGADGVAVESRAGVEAFDRVVIATHSDQALQMLSDPTEEEKAVLGAFSWRANPTVLHTDERFLPRRRRARASWNYHLPREPRRAPTVTYCMNILQNLRSRRSFCTTLNRDDEIDPAQVLRRMTYHHPVFTRPAVDAQARIDRISGVDRTYYAGAYWGYGFHEDGVRSGLAVARHFGRSL